MNYLETKILFLVKQRDELLNSGHQALKAYHETQLFNSNELLRLSAKRDIERAIILNSRIDFLLKENKEFLQSFSRRKNGLT